VPSENRYCFSKEFFLPIIVNKVVKGSCSSKRTFWLRIRNTCITQRKQFASEARHLAFCFPVRTELVIERNTSCNLSFPRWR
jgi:hypothetical protein